MQSAYFILDFREISYINITATKKHVIYEKSRTNKVEENLKI